MRLFVRSALALLVALAGAEATAGAQDKPTAVEPTAGAQAKPKRLQERNRITTDEVRAHAPGSVHQLIQGRRPHWLATRGLGTMQTRASIDPALEATTTSLTPEIVVYVENSRVGSQESLRSIHTDEVDSLEYLNAQDATQRFGTGHPYGAILIRRRVRN